MAHQFDAMTLYCVVCGAARQDVDDRSWECVDPERDRVTAVSHIVRGRRLRAAIEKGLSHG